jgi:hypothetical protein
MSYGSALIKFSGIRPMALTLHFVKLLFLTKRDAKCIWTAEGAAAHRTMSATEFRIIGRRSVSKFQFAFGRYGELDQLFPWGFCGTRADAVPYRSSVLLSSRSLPNTKFSPHTPFARVGKCLFPVTSPSSLPKTLLYLQRAFTRTMYLY